MTLMIISLAFAATLAIVVLAMCAAAKRADERAYAMRERARAEGRIP